MNYLAGGLRQHPHQPSPSGQRPTLSSQENDDGDDDCTSQQTIAVTTSNVHIVQKITNRLSDQGLPQLPQ